MMYTIDQSIRDMVIVQKNFISFEDADKDYKSKVKLEFETDNNKDIDLFERLEKLSIKYRKWIDKFDKNILQLKDNLNGGFVAVINSK